MLLKRITRFIIRLPNIIRLSYLLSNEKYERLEAVCNNKLKKKPQNYISLFFLFYAKIGKNALEGAEELFWRMHKNYSVGTKMKLTYIKKIVHKKIEEEKYLEVREECKNLISKEKNGQVRLLILRVLCEVNYKLEDFDQLKLYCEDLKEFTDAETTKFLGSYLNIIKYDV